MPFSSRSPGGLLLRFTRFFCAKRDVFSMDRHCRICHSDHGKLYSPCKCDGSIRWIHEECLMSWLKHANGGDGNVTAGGVKRCELCKAEFRFKNVYRSLTGEPPILTPWEFLVGMYPRVRNFVLYTMVFFNTAVLWLLATPIMISMWSDLCSIVANYRGDEWFLSYLRHVEVNTHMTFMQCLMVYGNGSIIAILLGICSSGIHQGFRFLANEFFGIDGGREINIVRQRRGAAPPPPPPAPERGVANQAREGAPGNNAGEGAGVAEDNNRNANPAAPAAAAGGGEGDLANAHVILPDCTFNTQMCNRNIITFLYHFFLV